MPRDVASMILAAFGMKSRLCMHQLMDMTGQSKDMIERVGTRLIREGVLRRRLIEGTESDFMYYRTTCEGNVPDDFGLDEKHLPLLLGLSEDEALSRVRMLKAMKDRLIEQWHPQLNKLIGDYERGLKAVMNLRYGASDDVLVDVASGEQDG